VYIKVCGSGITGGAIMTQTKESDDVAYNSTASCKM